MKYEEALQTFDRSLEINPADARVWCFKAEILLGLMQYEESLDSFYKAATLARKTLRYGIEEGWHSGR